MSKFWEHVVISKFRNLPLFLFCALLPTVFSEEASVSMLDSDAVEENTQFRRNVDYYGEDYYGSEWNENARQRAPETQCTIEIVSDSPKKYEPLYLAKTKDEINFVMPNVPKKNGVFKPEKGQQIIIACPGSNNNLEGIDPDMLEICKSENILIVGKKDDFNANDFSCTSKVTPMDIVSDEKCAKGMGHIIEMGYEHNKTWFPVVGSCHDVENSNTFYSLHIIRGAYIANKVKRKGGRPRFAKGQKDLFRDLQPRLVYSKKSQRILFEHILGHYKADSILSRTFLAKGHLAPDADFVFSALQFATYFFANVAPQWQSINAGNWLRLENRIRKVASKLGTDIQVLTGTKGVLRLQAENGEKQEIRLHHPKLRVPKYFWKVIRNDNDHSCIGFVVHNNPFLDKKPNQICPDICSKYDWPVLQDDFFKGYVYCCRYKTLKHAIYEMPRLSCRSVLNGTV